MNAGSLSLLRSTTSPLRPSDISVQFITTNGATIPVLGYGIYGMARSDMLRMIPAALNAGFRHFDTAQIYRNEAEVGHS
jgi:diketogulonate reductase-like aldo/keto reductase